MTVTLNLPSRGSNNWGTGGTTGLNTNLQALADEVNGLTLNAVEGGNIFNVQIINSAISVNANEPLPNIIQANFTASGKSLSLPDVTDSSYDGAVLWVKNTGANAFALKDNASSDIIAAIEPGTLYILHLTDDSTASGTWDVINTELENSFSFLSHLSDDTTPQLGGDLDGQGNILSNTEVRDLSEAAHNLGSISGAVTVDYENGHYQYGTVTGNITGLTINNLPASGTIGFLTLELSQDGTGGHSLTLGSAYETLAGEAVALTSTANAKDMLRFETRDAGVTIHTFINQDMK